jgi:hypothetical protein
VYAFLSMHRGFQVGVSLGSFARKRDARRETDDAPHLRKLLRLRGTGCRNISSPAAWDSPRNVSKYRGIVRRAGISRPLPAMMMIGSKALLFPPAPNISADQRPQLDWAVIHRECAVAAARPARWTAAGMLETAKGFRRLKKT